jgi:hypothetical protein
VAAGLDGLVHAERAKRHKDDHRSRQQRTPGPLAWGSECSG